MREAIEKLIKENSRRINSIKDERKYSDIAIFLADKEIGVLRDQNTALWTILDSWNTEGATQ